MTWLLDFLCLSLIWVWFVKNEFVVNFVGKTLLLKFEYCIMLCWKLLHCVTIVAEFDTKLRRRGCRW